MFLEAVILSLLLVLLIYKSTAKPAGLPPGPFTLPIIGRPPPLDVPFAEYFTNLRKQYGNIFSTKWGSMVIVVLADQQWIKKGMNHPGLQSRGDVYAGKIINFFMNLGVANSIGKVWRDNRRFLVHRLHNLGMGKTRMEESIRDEAQMLVDYLEETALDKPSEIGHGINVAALNVIWQLMAGKRYRADDHTAIQNHKMLDEGLEVTQGVFVLMDLLPWIRNWIPKFIRNGVMKVDVVEHYRDTFSGQCKSIIEEHKASLDPDNPRDVIDHYLLEIEANKKDPESTFRPDYLDLQVLMHDIFMAGSDTTSATLHWIILHLAIRPDIQSKAHTAIDAVVPKDRLPSLDDRPQLQYVDAMIMEVMRLTTLFPCGILHGATETVTLDGYVIPKNAFVVPLVEICHKDPEFWAKPNEFYPEHFLDAQGNFTPKKEAHMPFGFGRRHCIGEALARMELFLFVSAILQRFTIEAPPGVQLKAESKKSMPMTNVPEKYKVVLKKRI